MANPKIGQLVAYAWEMVSAVSAYGTDVGTIGWHRGEAYRMTWNFRTGRTEWRRLPHRDASHPPTPPPSSLRLEWL